MRSPYIIFCVLQLLKDNGIPFEVRNITINELLEAYNKGFLEDAFGTGTAATIAHISNLGYKDSVMELPPIHYRTISNNLKLSF